MARLVSTPDPLFDFAKQGIASGLASAEQPVRIRPSRGAVQVQPEIGPFAETENRVEEAATSLAAKQYFDYGGSDGQRRQRHVDDSVQEELELKEQQIANDHPTGDAVRLRDSILGVLL
jgi:hypothetical protein